MNKILLALMCIFTIILGLGASFMQYGMCSPVINNIMVVVGLLGFFITTWKFLKLGEDTRNKRIASNERQFKAIKKVIPSIKLKDNGSDIDEEVETLKENNIHINYKIKDN